MCRPTAKLFILLITICFPVMASNEFTVFYMVQTKKKKRMLLLCISFVWSMSLSDCFSQTMFSSRFLYKLYNFIMLYSLTYALFPLKDSIAFVFLPHLSLMVSQLGCFSLNSLAELSLLWRKLGMSACGVNKSKIKSHPSAPRQTYCPQNNVEYLKIAQLSILLSSKSQETEPRTHVSPSKI